MAILKHSTSKNMSYFDALSYLQYKHKEDPKSGFYKPILDEYGLLQERDNYALCYLNGYGMEGNPDDWPAACLLTNMTYRKNNQRSDRKQHIYVISHPSSDCPLLTKEALLEEGKAFVRENLKGYDALIAVHMDTDHYHIHISINSVRSVGRQEEPWMMKDEYGNTLQCEMKAGFKHQNNPQFRRHCQEWLLNYTRSHGFTIEDNLQIEDHRKQERYENQNERTRVLLLDTASKCRSFDELRSKLQSDYDISLVRRGRTISIHFPGSKKNRRLKILGLSEDDLYKAMGIDAESQRKIKSQSQVEFEKKQYMEWIRQRRARNSARADDTIACAANLIAGRIRESGHSYNPWEFRELNDLLRQTTYLQRDLETEHDKQNHLLQRWLDYELAEDSDQKETHKKYLEWCGCDPDSSIERDSLLQESQATELQIQEASALREALVETAEEWRDTNQENRFYYQQSWNISQEAQIKQCLKTVKANRKKLEQIAFHCEDAAYRRIYKTEYLKKAAYFREQWHQKLQQEDALKARLREIQEQKRANKKKSHLRHDAP